MLEYMGPLMPIIGNITRWSSDADALEPAFDLRDILNGFVEIAVTKARHAKSHCTTQSIPSSMQPVDNDQDIPDLVSGDELRRDDWNDLKTIFHILKPFQRLTLHLQGTET